MRDTILIESEATKADDLLTTALERLKQQTLANPTTANIDDTIAKVEAPFRDFKHDLELLRQKKSVHKLPEEFQALDCDRLENMRLAYWQERRLVQQSTEASIDLKAVESLEYLSLMHLDLEYLRQQRFVRSTRAIITETKDGKRRIEQNVTTMQGITNREDDNSMIARLDKLRRTPQQSSMDQSVLKSCALSLKRESRVNRDSRELGTLSNEIESFTSYYDVGGRDEPSDVIAHRKLSASIQQPQALASPRPEDTVDPVHAAESRHGNLSKRSLDAVIATSSSRGRPAAAKVVIPKIKSWEKSTTARAGQTSSPLASANQTAVPRARNLQDQSATSASTTPTVKMVPVENTALNSQNSQEQSHLITSVHSAQPDAKGSHVQSQPANLVQFAIPQLLGRREQSKWTAPVDLGTLNSEGSRTQKNPTTPVSPGTPKSLGRREQSKWTAPVPLATPKALGLHAHERPTTTSAQIPSSNTPKKHASPNASPSKMQTYQIKKKTDKKSQFSHSGQTRLSLPESWTTKSTTETRTESTKPQKISDVPTINFAKMVQKQTSTTPSNDEKTKMPGAKIESRLDSTSALVEAGSRNAQESTTTKNQDANLPKKLSKSARKKANQKQNKAMQKERERQEAAAIEAAIASSREQAELITESEAAETLASLRIERLGECLSNCGRWVCHIM
ncbi:hypothetical protein V8E51_019667 [Hyaloscypha variabilis]